MLRMLWNGTLSFGLVQAPVALYPASRRDQLGFDLLDRRTLARVGYRRINRETGEEVAQEDVVKGYRYADARYVVLSDEEIQAAADHLGHPAHSVDVVAFVARGEIPAMFYESPYYLAPGEGGEKAYALLRETLRRSGKIGIAQVVIRTRKHLAAIMPCGPALQRPGRLEPAASDAADFTAALMRSLSLTGANAGRQRESGNESPRGAAQPFAHTGK